MKTGTPFPGACKARAPEKSSPEARARSPREAPDSWVGQGPAKGGGGDKVEQSIIGFDLSPPKPTGLFELATDYSITNSLNTNIFMRD